MGGHVAFSNAPLCGWFREDQAKLAGRKFLGLLAAVTGLCNGMAGATVELAAVFVHEKALNAFF
jgi:hypothetical protein